MTLENCLKCPNHVSYSNGYVVCGYWKQYQQHVINQSNDGIVLVVGCSLDDNKNR